MLSASQKISTGNVDFDFGDLVFSVVTFLNPQEHFTRNDLIMEGVELFNLALDEIEQASVCVEVNGMNLHLHGCEVLILRSNVQRTILMQLL